MSHMHPDHFNRQLRHTRIRYRAEADSPEEYDDAEREATAAATAATTNSNSKLGMLTNYVNEAQKDPGYVREWIQRSRSASRRASREILVKANDPSRDGSQSPETSLSSSGTEGRQPTVRSVEAVSLDTFSGTSFLGSDQYLNDPALRPDRSRSPSPERRCSLGSYEEHNDLEHRQGADSGTQSPSHPRSRKSADEEDLIESLLESLAVAAARSFDHNDDGLVQAEVDKSLNASSIASLVLSEHSESTPPMAPSPPPAPVPPPPAPVPPPPSSETPPAGSYPMQPGMATALNIARSLACARYLRRPSEPQRNVAFESKATQADENSLPRDQPRYKDSSTQTCETVEIKRQSPPSLAQSPKSSSSSESKGSGTTGPSPPDSTHSDSPARAVHQHKAKPLPCSFRADGEQAPDLSEMRRSILTAKSQPLVKKPPTNATSTKLSRLIVNSEALALMGIPHESHAEHVVVHRILSRQQIIQLAELTIDIREARSKGAKAGERLWSQWSTDRYSIPWHRDGG